MDCVGQSDYLQGLLSNITNPQSSLMKGEKMSNQITLRNYSGLEEGSEGRIILVDVPDSIEGYIKAGWKESDLLAMITDKHKRLLNQKLRDKATEAEKAGEDLDKALTSIVGDLETYIFVAGKKSEKVAKTRKSERKSFRNVLKELKAHDKKACALFIDADFTEDQMDEIISTSSVEKMAEIIHSFSA